jgi:hypothetical protein
MKNQDVKRERKFKLSQHWNRVGLVADYDDETCVSVLIEAEGTIAHLDTWGLDCNILKLPDKLLALNPTRDELEALHVCPETFYLAHDRLLGLDINENLSSEIKIAEQSATIELKKCSYCGRILPLDSRRPSALAFHKHNAKLTGHQNECRACKKWRINKDFNPIRTVDQLHESSVITRERKLFL